MIGKPNPLHLLQKPNQSCKKVSYFLICNDCSLVKINHNCFLKLLKEIIKVLMFADSIMIYKHLQLQ